MRTMIITIGILLVYPFFVWAVDIHEAVKNNDVEEVKRLITNNPHVVTARDQYQMTPLHWAANKNDTLIAELLVHAGAHVNAPGNFQRTPLHESILNEGAGQAQLPPLTFAKDLKNVIEMLSF